MGAIEAIRAKLQEHPRLRWEEKRDSITVPAISPDGFAVSFHEHQDGFVVSYAKWHEEFESEEEALACFWFGLSDECRLHVISRGSFDYRWTVQTLADGTWRNASETGLFFFPFWRRARERFLQNHLIEYAKD